MNAPSPNHTVRGVAPHQGYLAGRRQEEGAGASAPPAHVGYAGGPSVAVPPPPASGRAIERVPGARSAKEHLTYTKMCQLRAATDAQLDMAFERHIAIMKILRSGQITTEMNVVDHEVNPPRRVAIRTVTKITNIDEATRAYNAAEAEALRERGGDGTAAVQEALASKLRIE